MTERHTFICQLCNYPGLSMDIFERHMLRKHGVDVGDAPVESLEEE